MPAQPPANLSRSLKFLVVGVLYFAEGMPFGFIITAMNAYMAGQGVPPEQIGILSLLGLAWSLKFFWSPLVDLTGSRASWMVGAQVAMILCFLGLSFLVGQPVTLWFWVLLGVLCVASATQDLAIDAYTIDFLETSELGMANGIRSGAYRVGSLAAGSGLLILSDWLGWRPALVGIGVLLAALVVTILVFRPFRLPRPPEALAARSASQEPGLFLDGLRQLFAAPLRGLAKWRDSAQGFITQVFTGLARHPHLGVIIVFVLIYKAGDALMGIMVIPFWKAQQFTNTEIGVVSGILGSVATTLGAFLGGWFTSRFGIGRGLLVLGIFQAVSNLGYWVAALPGLGRYAVVTLHLPLWDQSFAIYPIYLASQGESFSSGLGYAPFMAFLMSLCDKRFSATQYAFFVFLVVLSGRLMGFLGGFGVKYLGYADFFFMTFLVSLPAFALLPWILPLVRKIEGRESVVSSH